MVFKESYSIKPLSNTVTAPLD